MIFSKMRKIGIGLIAGVLALFTLRGAMHLGRILGGGVVVPPAEPSTPPPPAWLLPAIQKSHSGEMVHLITAFPPYEVGGREWVRCYYEVFEGEGRWRQECRDFVRHAATGEVRSHELQEDASYP